MKMTQSVTESLLTWMTGLADPRANNYVGKKKKEEKNESEGKDDPKRLLANSAGKHWSIIN